jgi:hypothetical protein
LPGGKKKKTSLVISHWSLVEEKSFFASVLWGKKIGKEVELLRGCTRRVPQPDARRRRRKAFGDQGTLL